MAIIDTLKLARELRDKGGFSQEAAEATAEALNDALGDEIATKRDVTDLNTGLGGEMAQLRTGLSGEMAQLRTGLSGEMVQLRTDLRGEMAQLRSDLRSEITQLGADLRKEMADSRAEFLKWMFGQTFVILAVVAALHFVKWTEHSGDDELQHEDLCGGDGPLIRSALTAKSWSVQHATRPRVGKPMREAMRR